MVWWKEFCCLSRSYSSRSHESLPMYEVVRLFGAVRSRQVAFLGFVFVVG